MAYNLVSLNINDGANVGAIHVVMDAPDEKSNMSWTLRVGDDFKPETYQWEELATTELATAATADGVEIGALVRQVERSATKLILDSIEFGRLEVDWATRKVCSVRCYFDGKPSGRSIGTVNSSSIEFLNQRKGVRARGAAGVSPGFQVYNATDWPVMIKIGQLGCLYYGVVNPGETRNWNTGAVWFEINASWKLDGEDLSLNEVLAGCVLPVELAVAGAIITAATAGTASGAVALGAIALTTSASASAANSFMTASDFSETDKDAVGIAIFTIGAAATGGTSAFLASTTKITSGVAKTIALNSAQSAAKIAASKTLLKLGPVWAAQYVNDSSTDDLDTLESWFADGDVTLAGQYAGYPWPWKMKDRTMPLYEISGGPQKNTVSENGDVMIREGTPFSFKKVN